MPTPDRLVATRGESTTLSRVTVPVCDAHGSFNLAGSTVENVTVLAIVSQPRQRELPPRMQGQEALRITIQSSVDVRADRPGRADRFTVRGRLYEVIEVRDDKHALRGIHKRTVLLAQLTIPQGSR